MHWSSGRTCTAEGRLPCLWAMGHGGLSSLQLRSARMQAAASSDRVAAPAPSPGAVPVRRVETTPMRTAPSAPLLLPPSSCMYVTAWH
ncbi:hypothetical protein GUJ93_ZPchr0458g22724 [Zizania palustris]|uniref:Uncharacterized protein n=1 Tax=Zizania palustris TaxID=103762 RepID=A0A8J5RDR4_ZIZPA|nr:hypothetical protein GUJ93_ZPchr0458g22724 [Zizania palustris]